MEAKLKAARGIAEGRGGDEIRQARCLAALDRYLKAVGLGDEKARHRLAKLAAEVTPAGCAEGSCDDWEQMIAAIDQVLCSQHKIEFTGDPQAKVRGRIAQRNQRSSGGFAPIGKVPADSAGWAAPPRCRQQMPAQDLSVSRSARQWLQSVLAFPSDVWRTQLLRLQFWRPAQGLTLGLLCLAVVLVP